MIPPPDPAAIEVEDATVRYGRVVALEEVSLHLAPGRVYGLLGTNGSGKSTLFKTVLGLVRADQGRVRIHGLGTAAARRKGLVGYVPQSEQVDWAFPVRVKDVVMMGRYGRMGMRRRPREEDHTAVAQALELTGLSDLAHRQIGALSGGQRKRAFVARGIAQQARVLLLDEPFAGVDKRSESALIGVLRRMRAEGRTLLVSTHDLAGVPGLCDEVVLLQRRVLAQGAPEQVLTSQHLLQALGLHPAVEESL